MSRQRKYNTEWHRRDAVERWQKSGLSQAEFCRKEGISENTLSSWKLRELGRNEEKSKTKRQPHKRAAKSANIEFAAIKESVTKPAALTAATFVPLVQRTALAITKDAGPAAEIMFASFSIRVFPRADAEILRTLLQVAKELSEC